MKFPIISSRQLMLSMGLLLILIFPFFFIGGPTFYSTPLFRALWDCGHLLFFAGLVVALHAKKSVCGWRPFVFISLVVFVVGGAIELIQAQVGRDGNWEDLLRDLVGTWLGLLWLQKSNLVVWVGRLAVMILLAPSIILVFLAAESQIHAQNNFPVLADFESAIDLHGWKGNIERISSQHSSGNYSLKFHLSTHKYSGVSFTEFYHSWQGYTTLSFDLYNPELPVDLVVRVSDVRHELGDNDQTDRFNRTLHLDTGWNHIEIPVIEIQHAPATRQLELDSITSFIIFAMKLQKAQDFYLDNLVLK